jgi:hypothetical protein
VVINAEFDREDYDSILYNNDWESNGSDTGGKKNSTFNLELHITHLIISLYNII